MPDIDTASIRYVEPAHFKTILDAIEDNAGKFRRRNAEFKPWLPLVLRTYYATGARPAEIVGKSARLRRAEEELGYEVSGIQEHQGLRACDLQGGHQMVLAGKNTMGGRGRATGLKTRVVTCAQPSVYRELRDLADRAPDPRANLFGLGPRPQRNWDGYWQLIRQVRKLRPFLPAVLQGFQPRWLRHSWAIHALRNGVDLVTVQRQLGHSDLEITAVYLRFAPSDPQKVLRAFQPPTPPTPQTHDCPACGFSWRTELGTGRLMLEDRMGVAFRRSFHSPVRHH